MNHPDPLVSGNYAPFVGRWLHEIAAEAAKQEPVPLSEGVVPSSPVFASRLSAMQSALIADFGSSAVMKDDFSVPVPSVVLPASSSRMSNVGDSSTEALSDSESGSVWDGSFPPCPGLDALVQNIPVIIDADGVVMPPVAAESSLHFDEDEVVRLSGVVSSLNGEADVGQSSLNSMSPAFSRSMSPSVLQQMKCEQNAAKIQELLQQAAAKRLVLSQGSRLLCGESSPLLDLVDPIDSNPIDRVAVSQIGSLAPGLVAPVVAAQLGSIAPEFSLAPVVSQLFSMSPALVTPAVPVVVTPLAVIQVDPVLSASSGAVAETEDQIFPRSGVVPSSSSHRRSVVEPLFHSLHSGAVARDGVHQQDSSACVQVLSSSDSVLAAADMLATTGVSVFFEPPGLASMDASAFSMLGGPSASTLMVEEDSHLEVLLISLQKKYLAVELVQAVSQRHFTGHILHISHSRTGSRRQTRGATVTVSTDRIQEFNPMLVGELVPSMVTKRLPFLGFDSSRRLLPKEVAGAQPMSALNAHGDMVMSNSLTYFVDSTGILTPFIPVTWLSQSFFQHELYSYDGCMVDASLEDPLHSSKMLVGVLAATSPGSSSVFADHYSSAAAGAITLVVVSPLRVTGIISFSVGLRYSDIDPDVLTVRQQDSVQFTALCNVVVEYPVEQPVLAPGIQLSWDLVSSTVCVQLEFQVVQVQRTAVHLIGIFDRIGLVDHDAGASSEDSPIGIIAAVPASPEQVFDDASEAAMEEQARVFRLRKAFARYAVAVQHLASIKVAVQFHYDQRLIALKQDAYLCIMQAARSNIAQEKCDDVVVQFRHQSVQAMGLQLRFLRLWQRSLPAMTVNRTHFKAALQLYRSRNSRLLLKLFRMNLDSEASSAFITTTVAAAMTRPYFYIFQQHRLPSRSSGMSALVVSSAGCWDPCFVLSPALHSVPSVGFTAAGATTVSSMVALAPRRDSTGVLSSMLEYPVIENGVVLVSTLYIREYEESMVGVASDMTISSDTYRMVPGWHIPLLVAMSGSNLPSLMWATDDGFLRPVQVVEFMPSVGRVHVQPDDHYPMLEELHIGCDAHSILAHSDMYVSRGRDVPEVCLQREVVADMASSALQASPSTLQPDALYLSLGPDGFYFAVTMVVVLPCGILALVKKGGSGNAVSVLVSSIQRFDEGLDGVHYNDASSMLPMSEEACASRHDYQSSGRQDRDKRAPHRPGQFEQDFREQDVNCLWISSEDFIRPGCYEDTSILRTFCEAKVVDISELYVWDSKLEDLPSADYSQYLLPLKGSPVELKVLERAALAAQQFNELAADSDPHNSSVQAASVVSKKSNQSQEAIEKWQDSVANGETKLVLLPMTHN